MRQKKLFKVLSVVTVLTVIAAFAVVMVEATQRTKATTATSSTDFGGYGYTTHVFAGPDTITWPVHFSKPSPSNGGTTVGQIAVLTANESGSSVISFRVRYEVSQDNVNWKSYTLGTDSTTFYTVLTSPSYLVNIFPITQADHGGYSPYSRLRMWQGASGDTNRVKLYALPQ